MNFTLLIEWLHQKKSITSLEKDILDTWNELQKSPFDRSSAQRQIMQNNAKHPRFEPKRSWNRSYIHYR